MSPHTFHLIQPLDLAAFGPLKTYLARKADCFFLNWIFWAFEAWIGFILLLAKRYKLHQAASDAPGAVDVLTSIAGSDNQK